MPDDPITFMEIGATTEIDGAGVESELTHYLAKLEDGYIKVIISRTEENRPTLMTISHIKDIKAVDLHRKLTQVLHPKLTHLEEPEYGSILSGFSSFDRLRLFRRAVFEAVAVVAGLDDMTVMRQSVQ